MSSSITTHTQSSRLFRSLVAIGVILAVPRGPSLADERWFSARSVPGDSSAVLDRPTLTGDVDGNGRMDLILVGQDWSGPGLNVRVKFSNGDGSWRSAEAVLGDDASVHARPALVADVDGDGDSDLVFVGLGWGGPGLGVRTNLSNRDGTWTSRQQYLGEAASLLDLPTQIGDVDGDRRADLVFVSRNAQGLGLEFRTKRSNGDGTWTSLGTPAVEDEAPTRGHRMFGPLAGWRATCYQKLPDGTARLLWSDAGGTASLWRLDASDQRTTYRTHGPYAGWTATSYERRGGSARLLWSHTNGTANLWTLDANDERIDSTSYSAGAGWTARSFLTLADGTGRILWTHEDGTASVWRLDGANARTSTRSYGPYPQWTARSIQAKADGTLDLLWSGTEGQTSYWSLDASDAYLTHRFGATHAGWTPASYQRLADGTARLLLADSTGRASLRSGAAEPILRGDVDGDQRMDLILVGQEWSGSGLAIRVKRSNGDGTWTNSRQVLGDPDPVQSRPTLVGDVDDDGRTDLVFVGDGWSGPGLNVRVKHSNVDGTWSAVEQVLGDPVRILQNPPLLADVSGDGRADLLFLGQDWSGPGLNLSLALAGPDRIWSRRDHVLGDPSGVHTRPALLGDVLAGAGSEVVLVGLGWSGPGLNFRTLGRISLEARVADGGSAGATSSSGIGTQALGLREGDVLSVVGGYDYQIEFESAIPIYGTLQFFRGVGNEVADVLPGGASFAVGPGSFRVRVPVRTIAVSSPLLAVFSAQFTPDGYNFNNYGSVITIPAVFGLLVVPPTVSSGGTASAPPPGQPASPPPPSNQPSLQVTPQTVDFGSIPAGGSSRRTFEVRNVGASGSTLSGSLQGTGDAHIYLGWSVRSFELVRGRSGYSESAQFTVEFLTTGSSDEGRTFTIPLRITSNDPAHAETVVWLVARVQRSPRLEVSGDVSGIAASSTGSTGTVDFGDVSPTASAQRSVVLTNVGEGTLNVQFSIGSATPGGFSGSGGFVSLAAGERRTLDYRCQPTQAGRYRTTAVIQPSPGPNVNLTLACNCVGPRLSINGDSASAPVPAVAFQPSPALIGTATPIVQEIRFTSTGPNDWPLSIDLSLPAGPFALQGGVTSYSLARGATWRVAVVFDPREPGTFSVPLTIRSGDPDRPQSTVLLQAVAVAGDPAVAVNGNWIGSDGAMTFAPTQVGGSPLEQAIFVANIGAPSSTLNVTVGLDGISQSFTLASRSQFGVRSGSYEPVLIRFAPQVAGELSNVIVIRSNDRKFPEYRIPVRGRGFVPPRLQLLHRNGVPPATIAIAAPLGGTSAESISITNVGPAGSVLEVRAYLFATNGPISARFLESGTLLASLPAGRSDQLLVSLSPTALGTFGSGLVIEVNVPNDFQHVFTVTGSAYERDDSEKHVRQFLKYLFPGRLEPTVITPDLHKLVDTAVSRMIQSSAPLYAVMAAHLVGEFYDAPRFLLLATALESLHFVEADDPQHFKIVLAPIAAALIPEYDILVQVQDR